MSEQQDDKPKFDFSRVGRSWSRAIFKTVQEASRNSLVISRPFPKNATEDEIQALFDKKDAAMARNEQLADEQSKLVSQVLVSVPREWLTVDAPADLAFEPGNIEQLEYIRPDKYMLMLESLTSGEAYKADAKN
jgi:hypothetical protein